MLLQEKILIRWVVTIQQNFCLDHTAHERILIVPSPYQVVLIYREGIRILHTFPRLPRENWTDLQKQSFEK